MEQSHIINLDEKRDFEVNSSNFTTSSQISLYNQLEYGGSSYLLTI